MSWALAGSPALTKTAQLARLRALRSDLIDPTIAVYRVAFGFAARTPQQAH
jgi:hypothetical protein